jgi:hypothetical protein
MPMPLFFVALDYNRCARDGQRGAGGANPMQSPTRQRHAVTGRWTVVMKRLAQAASDGISWEVAIGLEDGLW